MSPTPTFEPLPRTAIVELREPRPSLSGIDIPAGTPGTIVGVHSAQQGYAVEIIFEGLPSVINVEHSQVRLSAEQTYAGLGTPAAPDERLHYYAFTFGVLPSPGDAKPSGEMDTVYLGFRDERVTPAHINAARAECTIKDGAVLLNVNYFGHMTKEQFDVWG